MNKTAWHHNFRLMDQVANGIETSMMLPPNEQEQLLIEALIANANEGYPLFKPMNKKYAKKDLIEACQVVKIKLKLEKGRNGVEYITARTVLDIFQQLKKGKKYLPYMLFYRTQGSEGETKHRCVFGAHFLQKWLAALWAVGKSFGYRIKPADSFEDPIFDDKHIFAVGGLPIVAQQNWDKMFTAIKKRLPKGKMSAETIKELFNVDLAPGEYDVNVIVNDFPSYDTGMVPEDLEPAIKHKKLGWLMEFIINELHESKVWTGNKEVSDVKWKSGWFGTSDFGSGVNRNCVYGASEYWNKHGKPNTILAAVFLADDCIIFTIGLTSKMVNDYLQPYGLSIKMDESYDFRKHGLVEFLKVFAGKVFKANSDNTDNPQGFYSILGDPLSKYYGMAHQEREIEQELGSDDFRADTRGIWHVTGVVEIDAFISKLASFGSEGGPLVRVILEIVKDTDLGQKVILALSQLSSNGLYKPYREDLEISFPPNWLATLQVADLLLRRPELQ